MDISIFFDTIDEEIKPITSDSHIIGNNIRSFFNVFPAIEETDIAFIGLPEANEEPSSNKYKSADAVRSVLYYLKKGIGNYHIVDLGNLRPGSNQEETTKRLREVCEVLYANEIIPIIIGGSHDLDYGQFLAYENTGKLINVLNIDAEIDMSGNKEIPNKHHIHQILMHQPNIVFNYAHLAHQSYLVDREMVNILDKLSFEIIRLGKIRDNIQDIEPIIRDADMLTFDIGALKSIDAPGQKNIRPFGLTGEEACTLFWYAGLSSKLSSLGIYEIDMHKDPNLQTAHVISTMLWYFIEGFYSKKEEFNVASPNFTKYIIPIEQTSYEIIFYKHIISEKWWMEVELPEGKDKYARNCFIPCSYNDYLNAGKGIIPDRWLATYNKLH